MRTGASVLQATVPLSAGFGITFDPETQFVGPDVLFGGSLPRLLRLNAAGQRALSELRGSQVETGPDVAAPTVGGARDLRLACGCTGVRMGLAETPAPEGRLWDAGTLLTMPAGIVRR